VRHGRITVSKIQLDAYRAKTQPDGVPKVGRPSKAKSVKSQAEHEQFLEKIHNRTSDIPFTVEQLIAERNAMNAVLGDRIRRRRLELGWSQQQLGRYLGFTRELIAQYEAGRSNVNAADLPLFAKVMEVPLLWFYHEHPPLTSTNPLWAHINVMSEEDRKALNEIAAILVRRRTINTQEAFQFGREVEASLVEEVKSEDQRTK
jgi:transcriptional regulator with XRE-family HTH domain